jgi:hypothetical protein
MLCQPDREHVSPNPETRGADVVNPLRMVRVKPAISSAVLRAGLTLTLVGAALLLVPGSALAAGGLAIDAGSDTGVTVTNGCTFEANTPGSAAIVNVDAIDVCLEDGHSVVVTDPSGDAGSIDVDAALAPTSCSGASLTFDEAGGDVEINNPIDLGSCNLELHAATTITQAAAITAGALTIESSGSTTLSSLGNEVADLHATSTGGAVSFADETALTLTGLNADSGATLSADGDLTVSGAASVGGTLSLTTSGGTIDQDTHSATITAGTLTTSNIGSGSTTLENEENKVAVFEGSSVSGVVDLYDNEGTLDVQGISSSDDFAIRSSGNIDVEAESQATDDASLTSSGGTVTESGGGSVGAATLIVEATAVSLPETNAVSTLNATATDGNVSAYLFYGPTKLGAIHASGSVDVTDGDHSLEPTGTISGQSIALEADGITTASANSAELSAPSVSITDTDMSDAWTVTPSTIAAQGTGTIVYSGASSLSITGGQSFNVTPSSATTMAFTGVSTPAALTYNAQGRVVSGPTTASSGQLDAPGVDPVTFSGMTSVMLSDPATAPPVGGAVGGGSGGGGSTGGGSGGGGTTGTTSNSGNAPTCTLRASSSKATLPKRVHGKLKGKATLTLVATCSGALHAILSARITVVSKPAHGKKKSKYYPMPGVRASVAAGAPTTIVLDVPKGAVSALSTKGDKLSAMFTLADTDNGDSVLKTIRIERLT